MNDIQYLLETAKIMEGYLRSGRAKRLREIAAKLANLSDEVKKSTTPLKE